MAKKPLYTDQGLAWADSGHGDAHGFNTGGWGSGQKWGFIRGGHYALGGRGDVSSGWVLDPNKNWKTKWAEGTKAGHKSWFDPWGNRLTAGDRAALTTQHWYDRGSISTGHRSSKHRGAAIEVIDWDAYDRDNLYGAWLTHTGKDKFKRVEDIEAAEAWMRSGGGLGGGEDYDDAALRGLISGNTGSINDLRNRLGDYSTVADRSRLLGVVNARLTDLESVGIRAGDIEDLRDQLQTMESQQATGDQRLEDLINDYRSQGRIDMADRLSETRQMLRGEWGQDIANLDIAGIRQSIEGARGDIGSLRGDFAGLEGDLTTMEAQLRGDYGQKLTDLERRTEGNLAETERGLRGDLSDLELATADARAQMREDTANRFTEVEADYNTRINDLRTNLTQAQHDQKADILRTRQEQIAALEDDWGDQLQQQEQTLSGEIDKEATALHERIRKISSSLNYRMLGDTAGGVAMRRSKAYTSGRASEGTGQLARAEGASTMQISSLNI